MELDIFLYKDKNMKLTICANHSYSHIGGTEFVIQQIAEHMVQRGFECDILSKSCKYDIIYNGVKISFCGSGPTQFINRLEASNPDIVLVYSDFFKYWSIILDRIHRSKFKLVLIPVGFNASISDPALLNLFLNKEKYIQIVTHSDNYQDYALCEEYDIPVQIIPNGINLKEFKKQNFSFRKKYRIDTEKIILCVSNFFPGKGQEFLPKIFDRVYQDIQDFIALFISSTVEFRYAQLLRQRFKRHLKEHCFNYKMLSDIPREDVIQSYFESDVFVLPSQKEVAPIVILESMAAGLPWIAMEVGNVNTLSGGYVITDYNKDINGNLTYTPGTFKNFVEAIKKVLLLQATTAELSDAGRRRIENDLNWEKISDKYYDLFTRLL